RRERDRQGRRRGLPPPLRRGLRPAGLRVAAHERLRAADARARRAADVPRRLVESGRTRRAVRGVGRRHAAPRPALRRRRSAGVPARGCPRRGGRAGVQRRCRLLGLAARARRAARSAARERRLRSRVVSARAARDRHRRLLHVRGQDPRRARLGGARAPRGGPAPYTRLLRRARRRLLVNVPFMELARGVAALRRDLDAAICAVLARGQFVLGQEVAAFEAEFAAYCGAREAVGVEPGDEVIVPANTCVPTVAGVEAAGAVPVLADVDPETWTLAPAAAAAAVSERTRAVVPVHLYGLCADVDGLRGLGLKIVEDAAQAHGAELHGRRAGTLGDAAAFSFYPTKNLGGLGDGGAV